MQILFSTLKFIIQKYLLYKVLKNYDILKENKLKTQFFYK